MYSGGVYRVRLFLSVGMRVKCTVYIGKDNITGKFRNVDFGTKMCKPRCIFVGLSNLTLIVFFRSMELTMFLAPMYDIVFIQHFTS